MDESTRDCEIPRYEASLTIWRERLRKAESEGRSEIVLPGVSEMTRTYDLATLRRIVDTLERSLKEIMNTSQERRRTRSPTLDFAKRILKDGELSGREVNRLAKESGFNPKSVRSAINKNKTIFAYRSRPTKTGTESIYWLKESP